VEAGEGRLWRLTSAGEVVGEPVPFAGGEISFAETPDSLAQQLFVLREPFARFDFEVTEQEFWTFLRVFAGEAGVVEIRQELTDWARWEDDGGRCFG
jgi:hypothetical protein